MRLATIKEFQSLFFTPDSRPSLDTLRRRIDKGTIAGGRVDAGRYYVDLDAWDEVHQVGRDIEKRKARLAKSPLLDGLI